MVESGETLENPSLRRLLSTEKGLLGNPLLSRAEPTRTRGGTSETAEREKRHS